MDYRLNFHHIGSAVKDLKKAAESFKRFLNAEFQSNVVSDPVQKVDLMLIKVGGVAIELVSGDKVSRFISSDSQSSPYHVCYEVDDFDRFVDEYSRKDGAILSSPPEPAVLFNGRRVAFFMVRGVGIIEILEGAAG